MKNVFILCFFFYVLKHVPIFFSCVGDFQKVSETVRHNAPSLMADHPIVDIDIKVNLMMALKESQQITKVIRVHSLGTRYNISW